MATLISPEQARNIGHTVIDVREFPEYAAGAIKGSRLVPSLRSRRRRLTGTGQSRFFSFAEAEREPLKQQGLWSGLDFRA
jgi:hypothetical protein